MSSDNNNEVLSKLDVDVNELKSEIKITGFKIIRIEKSLDDMSAVLDRLTDVYHNQSMIQKDIINIYKEISDIRTVSETTRQENIPVRNAVSEHITSFKTATRVIVAIAAVVYGIGAWVLNEAYQYNKQTVGRVDALELKGMRAESDNEEIKSSLMIILEAVKR